MVLLATHFWQCILGWSAAYTNLTTAYTIRLKKHEQHIPVWEMDAANQNYIIPGFVNLSLAPVANKRNSRWPLSWWDNQKALQGWYLCVGIFYEQTNATGRSWNQLNYFFFNTPFTCSTKHSTYCASVRFIGWLLFSHRKICIKQSMQHLSLTQSNVVDSETFKSWH